jgi:serine/threonine protein kinase
MDNIVVFPKDRVCPNCHERIAPEDSYEGYCFKCLLAPAFDFDDPGEERSNGRLDAYEILRYPDGSFIELGRGSMGITYHAIDTNLQFPVALKVIDFRSAGQEANRDRFLREARAAAKLRHPHVASVFHYGVRENNRCFYAMELVQGETLAERVQRRGPFPISDALEVILQVARALEAAEQHGLVHRDLKPANLMLANEPGINTKVIDFGLARMADPAEANEQAAQEGFIGTPAFASPEQFFGKKIDQRSDYFSLGSTLIYLLTGNPPFIANSIPELAEQIKDPQPVIARLRMAGFPAPVLTLVSTLLSPHPRDRPSHGSALIEIITQCQTADARAGSKRAQFKRYWIPLALVSLAIMLGGYLWLTGWLSRETTDKTIAVLPFEDRSPAEADSYFADGIQDDILNSLAKIADLRVISRRSVQDYKNPANRPPSAEIGKALHVGYLLNGSILREGNRIRVIAELEEARTGRRLWADRYDGELTDVFTIQAELAEAVSLELQAKLSSTEKGALEARPTQDFAAYELYLHAKELLANYSETTQGSAPTESAVRLLDEAVNRDRDFALAWCLLAKAHDVIYQFYADRTDSRRMAAERALQQALSLKPDLGEAHLEKAYHLLVTTRDYPTIRKELEIARRTLPNSSYLYGLLANVQSRQGQWKDVGQDLEKAHSLDPRNMNLAVRQYNIYQFHRQYDQTSRISNELVSTGPVSPIIAYQKAVTAWQAKGDLAPLRALIDESTGPLRDIRRATVLKITVALLDRDFLRAEQILAKDPKTEFEINDRRFVGRDWILGWIKYRQGDKSGALMAFAKARPVQFAYVEKMPDDPNALIMLAYTDAALGRKEEANVEAQKAVKLLPLSLDALEAPMLAEDLAEVYLWADEPEMAMKQLETLEEVPRAVMYGDLAKGPEWDSLRSDPRFQRILSQVKQPIPIVNRRE